jgi:tRNA nucleotidyltransferase (CCA-adding enzyme)
MAESPYRMFTVLLGCGAFQKLFKNIEPKYLDERHQEALKASIDRFKEVRASLAVRFAVINYIWPIAQTLRVPKECIEMADLLAKTYTTLCNSIQLKGEELLSFLQVCDALRRPDRFDELLLGARCLVLPTHDKEGSKVVLEKLYTSTHHIKHMQKVALSVDHKEIALQAIKQGLVAVQIGEAIDQARLKALEAAMKKL